MKNQSGVTSFTDWRFSMSLSLYVLSIFMFAETGEPAFKWSQFFFSAIISFLVVTTVCWQWHMLGNPKNKANLILHIALFITCIFFINRLFVKDSPSLIDIIIGFGEKMADSIVSWIPDAVFNVMRSPGIAILFIMIALSLSFRRKIGLPLLILSLFFASIISFSSQSKGNPGSFSWFFTGMIPFAIAIYLQADDHDKREFWSRVYDRLKGDTVLTADIELKTRLLKRMHELNRPISAEKCAGIISRALQIEMDSQESFHVTNRVVRQLIYQDHLTKYAQTASGKYLCFNPEEFKNTEPDDFEMIAVIPKAIIISVFAVLWILSPIDLILDATPIIGTVDDVIMGTLAFTTTVQSFTGIQINRMIRQKIESKISDNRLD